MIRASKFWVWPLSNAGRRLASLAVAWALIGGLAAAPPAEDARRLRVVGQPATLIVQPVGLELHGPWSTRQLVVTGRYADNSERDLTTFADYSVDDPTIVEVLPGGFIWPRGNGHTVVTVRAAHLSRRLSVTVTGLENGEVVSFRHQVIAALNVAGCNAGACHGTPSGKNGFKLSLRGFDPTADYYQLTHDVGGRRVNRHQPEASLMLLKATGQVPHEGGQRLLPGTEPTGVVREWLRRGLPDDPADLPAVRKLEIVPGNRVLATPARWQQVAVVAHFVRGEPREVTRLTVFRSSDEGIARVSPEGLVEFQRSGEVAILCRYLEEMASVRLTYVEPARGYRWPDPPAHNYVDRHLFAKQKLLAIRPSDLAGDAEFVRRAYLDVCGVLPTPAQVEAFLGSRDQDKRARLIDHLLDSPEYTDFWALKWADVLGNNRRAVQAKGAYLYHQWLREHLATNTPFDRVVRQLLTAGSSTFLNPPANYFRNDRKVREPEELAQNLAQQFFGIRLSCARCHNHPFERWTQDDYYGLAAFFARVKDRPDPLHPRLNRFNQGALDVYIAQSGEETHLRTGRPVPPRFPGGRSVEVPPSTDRREILADWLTRSDNPFFARSVVNRIWYHLLGRGIVDPVDDFRDSNPPASDELLDELARDFVAHRFDVRHVIRTVTASRIYQLSAATNLSNQDDQRFFSHAVTRLHPAEVLLDAVSAATDVPEVFPGMPPGTRAVQLPDGDVFQHPFLKAFGQPARETACECERQGDTSLGHALQLINGPTVKAKLTAPNNRLGRLLAERRSDPEILRELYLATLSRPPWWIEQRAVLEHVRHADDRRKAWEDVQWALLNSWEFLLRH
jgi:hypothetical protein